MLYVRLLRRGCRFIPHSLLLSGDSLALDFYFILCLKLQQSCWWAAVLWADLLRGQVAEHWINMPVSR